MKNIDNWENEYKKSMGEISFSADDKTAILKKLMASETSYANVTDFSTGSAKRKKTGKTLKPAAAAALVAGIIGAGTTVGVCAATGVIPVADAFKNVYEISENSRETAEVIGSSLGSEVVSGGIKITADAVIGDKRHCAVIYSIEKEDGSAFDEGWLRGDDEGTLFLGFVDGLTTIDLDEGKYNEYSGTSYFYYDENDKKIHYVETFDSYENIIGGRMKSSFKDIVIRDFEGEYINGELKLNDEVVAEGRWDFDIPLQYEDSGHLHKIDKVISYNETPVYTEFLNVSSIGYEIRYRAYGLVPAVLVMKDGTEINMADGGYSIEQDEKSMIYTYSSMFNRIYDHGDAEAVRIGDTLIDIDDMSLYHGTEEALEEEIKARSDGIFTDTNKGLMYFEVLYEGDESYEYAGVSSVANGEMIGRTLAGSVSESINKGERLICEALRDDLVIKHDEDNITKTEKMYSLDEVSLKLMFLKNDEVSAEVDLGGVAKEFGKVYRFKVTGNEKNGFNAEYLGEGVFSEIFNLGQ